MDELEQRYLKSLAKQYPTIASASTEIINLQAILSLPKGTEHFMTDIHGEYEQFNHVLKNGSGSVRRKIDEEFGNTLSNKDKKVWLRLFIIRLRNWILYCGRKMRTALRTGTRLRFIGWYRLLSVSHPNIPVLRSEKRCRKIFRMSLKN